MASFYEYVPGPHLVQGFCSPLHVILAAYGEACQFLSFRNVRCQQVGAREKSLLEDGQCFPVDEFCSTLGQHHRIYDDDLLAILLQLVGDDADVVCGEKHACLYHVYVDIGQNGIQLLRQEFCRHTMDGCDSAGILGCEGSHCRRTIGAEKGDGFQVGLNAGPAAGVAAGDGKDIAAGELCSAVEKKCKFGSCQARLPVPQDRRNNRQGVCAVIDYLTAVVTIDTPYGNDRQFHPFLYCRQCFRAGQMADLLAVGGEHGAQTYVIGTVGLSLEGFFQVVGGYTDDLSRAKLPPCLQRTAVLLAKMKPVCVKGLGQRQIIIDEKGDACFGTLFFQLQADGQFFARLTCFFPILNDADTAVDAAFTRSASRVPSSVIRYTPLMGELLKSRSTTRRRKSFLFSMDILLRT